MNKAWDLVEPPNDKQITTNINNFVMFSHDLTSIITPMVTCSAHLVCLDLDTIRIITDDCNYEAVYASGFSLGPNVILKWESTIYESPVYDKWRKCYTKNTEYIPVIYHGPAANIALAATPPPPRSVFAVCLKFVFLNTISFPSSPQTLSWSVYTFIVVSGSRETSLRYSLLSPFHENVQQRTEEE
jgi:hypothetical protein